MKLYLTLLAWLCTAFTGLAQFNFGPVFGLNSTTIAGHSDYRATTRYYGGAFANLNFGNYRFALQAEGLIIGAGSEASTEDPVSDYRVTLNYIALPVQLKIRFLRRFHLGLGYQVGALMGGTERFSFNGSPREIDVSDDYRNGDRGGFGELGFQAQFGLGFHVRFYRGTGRLNLKGEDDLFNSYLQAGVFYAFGEKSMPPRLRDPRIRAPR